jgi:hypothetical protein
MRSICPVALVFCACSAAPTPLPDGQVLDATDANGTTDAVSDGSVADASYAPCPSCCDPILQNCPNAGDACIVTVLLAGTPTTCVPAGTDQPEVPCAQHVGSSECLPGSQCGPLNDPGPGIYVCSKLCTSDVDCFTTRPTCTLYPNLVFGICL